MYKRFYVLVAVVVAVALLAACGGGGGSNQQSGGTATTGGTGATGNAGNGETLFKQSVIGANPGCVTCHSIDGSKLVGPTLQGIGTRAATREQGKNADAYLRESITQPDAYVVEGFTKGVMPSYANDLNEQQLNDMVAYLLALK